MVQTKAGAKKARAKMIERFGSEEAYKAFMAENGRKGGKLSSGRGFGEAGPGAAGRKGGFISRRGHTFLYEQDGYRYYNQHKTGQLVKYRI